MERGGRLFSVWNEIVGDASKKHCLKWPSVHRRWFCRLKALAAKPEKLRSIPGAPVVDGEKQITRIILCGGKDLLLYMCVFRCPQKPGGGIGYFGTGVRSIPQAADPGGGDWELQSSAGAVSTPNCSAFIATAPEHYFNKNEGQKLDMLSQHM